MLYDMQSVLDGQTFNLTDFFATFLHVELKFLYVQVQQHLVSADLQVATQFYLIRAELRSTRFRSSFKDFAVKLSLC